MFVSKSSKLNTKALYPYCRRRVEWGSPLLISQPVYIPVPSSFPNPSPTVTLHHSQWFLWAKRSQEESHWFFCIIASHSEPLFQWVAVSETTRALLFVVVWLLLPRWKKTHQAASPLLSLWMSQVLSVVCASQWNVTACLGENLQN